jgi:hypothetical protein
VPPKSEADRALERYVIGMLLLVAAFVVMLAAVLLYTWLA